MTFAKTNFDLDAEQKVLAYILYSNAVSECLFTVDRTHFFDPVHADIISCLRAPNFSKVSDKHKDYMGFLKDFWLKCNGVDFQHEVKKLEHHKSLREWEEMPI